MRNVIEVFRTDVEEKDAAEKLVKQLVARFGFVSVNIDLDDCDRVLRIEDALDVDVDSVVSFARLEGYEIEVLPE